MFVLYNKNGGFYYGLNYEYDELGVTFYLSNNDSLIWIADEEVAYAALIYAQQMARYVKPDVMVLNVPFVPWQDEQRPDLTSLINDIRNGHQVTIHSLITEEI